MTYEVENKFPIAERAVLVERLADLGAQFDDPVEQVDAYFAHPVRDFAQTDEALRIRRIGEMNLVTYKGPKIDRQTKTRREIELPLARGAERARDYATLLEALGFTLVCEVRKSRHAGTLVWQQWDVGLALDDVVGLGEFVELEIVVDRQQLGAAQAAVVGLARQLGLPEPERRSYLEMVLERRQQ